MASTPLRTRLGRFQEAVSDLTRLIELRDSDPSALLRRGMAYELAGQVESALSDYATAAAADGPAGEYAALWQYVLLKQTGQDDAASKILDERPREATGAVWCTQLFDFYAHTITPENLLKSAVTDDERAEVFYYIGRKTLLDGRTDDARQAFSNCVDLNRDSVMEAIFARALCHRLTVEVGNATSRDEEVDAPP